MYALYGAALSLLHRDVERLTLNLLSKLPDWSNSHAWETDPLVMRAMLFAVKENSDIVLPAEMLVEHARRMAADGHPQVAHAYIALLERDSQAEGLIEELCSEETPLALRAAAWSERLKNAGLPFLSKYGVPERLWVHLPELHPDVQKALRIANCLHMKATIGAEYYMNPERLFFEGCDAYLVEKAAQADFECMLADMEEIGAPLAARLLRAMKETLEESTAGEEHQASELTRPHGPATAASLELELALARYIWERRELFISELKKY